MVSYMSTQLRVELEVKRSVRRPARVRGQVSGMVSRTGGIESGRGDWVSTYRSHDRRLPVKLCGREMSVKGSEEAQMIDDAGGMGRVPGSLDCERCWRLSGSKARGKAYQILSNGTSGA